MMTPIVLRTGSKSGGTLEVGAVFLLETLQGKLALIRIEAVTRQEVRLRWLLDGDDDGRFGAVEAYWRGEVEAPPAEKE